MAEPRESGADARTRFLSEQEVQEVLDAGPGQFRCWCAAGVFPGAQTDRNGRWRVPVDDVRAAIEAGVTRYLASARQRLAYVLRPRPRPDPASACPRRRGGRRRR